MTWGKAEKRQYLSPGAYMLLVDGDIQDIVPYLVLHLLTGPNMVTLARCPAPEPGNWSERCGRFIVQPRRGRPRVFCSLACRVREHAKQLKEEEGRFLKKRI